MKKKETIVVNLIGGPGVGKSILTAKLFARIKEEFISCEISDEFIKKKLREKALKSVESQIYIFANQQFQLFSLKNEVDVIVTDSPIIFSIVYDKSKCPMLRALILKEFNKYNNLNYLVLRDESVPYEVEGRYQDAESAKKIDSQVVNLLTVEGIEYKTVYGVGETTIETILADVKAKLNEQQQ